MTLRGRLKSAHLAAVVGLLIAAGAGLALHEFRFGAGLVRRSYDLLHVWRGDTAVHEAVLVYLDEVSYLKLGQPLNAPWDRSLHARLIERLTRAGARAIVFDVAFTDPNSNNPAADTQLAQAIRQSGRVLLAADNVRVGPGEKQILPPFDLLRDAAADNIGSDELTPDPDLVVREHTPRADNPLPSLAWATAHFLRAPAANQESAETVPRWMSYYGPPNFLPGKSYWEALAPAVVPDEFFRDKVVFIGGRLQTKFAGERKDEYPNPYSFWLSTVARERQEGLFSSGVEIQATAFLNLLRGDWLRRLSFGTERVLILLAGAGFGLGLIRFHPMWAALAATVALGVIGVCCYYLFVRELLWVPWLILVVQIGIALSWSVLFNSVQLYVQKRLYEQTLRIYLPPNLVRKFAGSRELLRPGAAKHTLTLFFSDIADFTAISEGMDPDDLAQMMNDYFERAIPQCIHRTEGTVAKYIGDAIFAFWNAPDAQTGHATLACEAALRLREETRKPINGRILHTRIGLHTGVANVGNFGSLERVDYTALGQSVNLASRLEGLNKHLGTDCLISEATKLSAGEAWLTRDLGSFQLKGFEGQVRVYELIDRADAAAVTRAWREAFAEALRNFEQRNLEFAAAGFRRVLEFRPEDGPSKFYLNRIEELSKATLPEAWATHTIFKEK
jgi:adenylate cyclase